ncbi:Killer Cell Lectin-Like Receptor Subfamily F Member 2 [Manis pentadactyla]|nr:Killer Cell Lectin-Like Receptor Subfamily F Member 2 [Manis pentadactyla]
MPHHDDQNQSGLQAHIRVGSKIDPLILTENPTNQGPYTWTFSVSTDVTYASTMMIKTNLHFKLTSE